jgi:carboxypeptidase D
LGAEFIVNGTNIPEVTFDIGESYAGLLPIPSSGDLTSELYFWFFPTANPDGKDEITIWLNGGPGCSSLEGLLQENGPFLWNYGTFRPVSNPWSWHLLTNMLYVEQPVGTGFSRGLGTELTGEDVAKSFLGFLQNFIDTFGLQNKKIYITGESFAGMYVPYIADAMFATKDKTHFDVRGTMIYE